MDWKKFNATLGANLGQLRPLTSEGRAHVTALLEKRRELEAIRVYRDETRASLSDAVQAVRDLQRV